MSRREPPSPWLPTSAQLAMASERAILASLDLNLQLAVRFQTRYKFRRKFSCFIRIGSR